MLEHVDAVVFDADHTLYTPHSDAAYEAKFSYLAEATGAEQEQLRRAWERVVENAVQTTKPGPHERKRLIAEAIERVGATADENLVNDAYSVFWDVVADNLGYADETAGMVRRLKSDGFKLAIATDEEPEPLRLKLNQVFRTTSFEDIFDTVVTRHDTGKRKPSKTFYTPILTEMRVTAGNAVMVGDSWVRDLKPADDLGMQTVLLLDADRDNDDGEPDERIDALPELEPLLRDA